MTLVEKMARAMNPECFEPEVERVYGDLWAFDKQAKMRKMALAALKAIRVPTLKMARAGKPATGSAAMSDWTWCAMVEAAIAENVVPSRSSEPVKPDEK